MRYSVNTIAFVVSPTTRLFYALFQINVSSFCRQPLNALDLTSVGFRLTSPGPTSESLLGSCQVYNVWGGWLREDRIAHSQGKRVHSRTESPKDELL